MRPTGADKVDCEAPLLGGLFVCGAPLLQRYTGNRKEEICAAMCHPNPRRSQSHDTRPRAVSHRSGQSHSQPVAVALAPHRNVQFVTSALSCLRTGFARRATSWSALGFTPLLQTLEHKTGTGWPLDLVVYRATSSDGALCAAPRTHPTQPRNSHRGRPLE